MRASLISREVIADSIELMVHAHDFDALVCLVGCDKTVPAALMALARVDKPAVVLYSGPMRAGRLHGREVTIQDRLGGGRRRGTRADPASRARRARAVRLSRRGNVRGPLHRQHDGRGARLPRHHRARRRADPRGRARGEGRRRRACRHARGVARRRPSRTFLDRRALLNAMTGIAATGGSTNGILHLLAIAREAGVPLTLDELAEIGARTPVIASLAPSGRYVAEDLHRVGGTAAADRRARARRPVRRRRADGHGRDARRRDARRAGAGRRGALPDRAAVQGDGRAARAARQPGAGRQPREGLRTPCAATSAARHVSSTARRRAPTPFAPASCRPATCSSSATKGRRAARGCARCWA